MKHLDDLHNLPKEISAQILFKGEEGKAMSIQIRKDGLLKEHITQVPALLICVKGEVVFEDENGGSYNLKSGNFHHIEPLLKHWVRGIQDSQLVLLK